MKQVYFFSWERDVSRQKKIIITAILLDRKILAGIFQFGKLDLSRDFLGIQNNLKIPDSYIICYFLEIFMAWKFVIGCFWGFF